MRDFLDAGVALLWVIYPDARLRDGAPPGRERAHGREDGVLDGEDVLPGFRLELGELFRGMP